MDQPELDELGIVQLLGRLDERTSGMAEKVDKLAHVLLEGNGVPAVTVQLATLNEKVATIEKDRDSQRVPRHVWLGIAVSIILALAGILIDAKVV